MANGSHNASDLVAWLKAVGESSRLRLLALCAERDLSVSDLAQAVAQSEPRVSRHLKILCEAGLVVRLRQGQWVHYRLDRLRACGRLRAGPARSAQQGGSVLARDRSRLLAASSSTAPTDARHRLRIATRSCPARLHGSERLVGVVAFRAGGGRRSPGTARSHGAQRARVRRRSLTRAAVPRPRGPTRSAKASPAACCSPRTATR